MSRMRTVGLVAGLVLGTLAGGPALSADASPAAGFATPEEAVEAYVAAVAAADLEAVLATAAIEEVAQDTDFVGYVDRVRAWIPVNAPAPATHPFLVSLNRSQQTAQLLLQTRMFIYSLLTTADLSGRAIMADAAWAETFVDELDLDRLAGLEVTEIGLADEAQTSDRYRENADRQAAILGADELTDRVAIVTFEGARYRIGFMLLRHGDAWKVHAQFSPLAGTDPLGIAEPVEE